MGRHSHPCILKVQEVFVGNDKIHLVSSSLKASHTPLSDLSFLPSESQVKTIVEKLVQMCHALHSKNHTVANLHPNNIFIDEDYPEDVLVTDVGFAYMTGMDPETTLQTEFSAPEVRGKSGLDMEKAVNEFPQNCDLYSIGAIAKYLLFGATHYSSEDCEGQVSLEMQEFMQRVESENPFERASADVVLRLPLFDSKTVEDPAFAEQRNAQRSAVSARMKAMGQASIME